MKGAKGFDTESLRSSSVKNHNSKVHNRKNPNTKRGSFKGKVHNRKAGGNFSGLIGNLLSSNKSYALEGGIYRRRPQAVDFLMGIALILMMCATIHGVDGYLTDSIRPSIIGGIYPVDFTYIFMVISIGAMLPYLMLRYKIYYLNLLYKGSNYRPNVSDSDGVSNVDDMYKDSLANMIMGFATKSRKERVYMTKAAYILLKGFFIMLVIGRVCAFAIGSVSGLGIFGMLELIAIIGMIISLAMAFSIQIGLIRIVRRLAPIVLAALLVLLGQLIGLIGSTADIYRAMNSSSIIDVMISTGLKNVGLSGFLTALGMGFFGVFIGEIIIRPLKERYIARLKVYRVSGKDLRLEYSRLGRLFKMNPEKRSVVELALLGVASLALGIMLCAAIFPNRAFMNPSFMFLGIGAYCLIAAIIQLFSEVFKLRRLFTYVCALGSNYVAVYVLNVILTAVVWNHRVKSLFAGFNVRGDFRYINDYMVPVLGSRYSTLIFVICLIILQLALFRVVHAIRLFFFNRFALRAEAKDRALNESFNESPDESPQDNNHAGGKAQATVNGKGKKNAPGILRPSAIFMIILVALIGLGSGYLSKEYKANASRISQYKTAKKIENIRLNNKPMKIDMPVYQAKKDKLIPIVEILSKIGTKATYTIDRGGKITLDIKGNKYVFYLGESSLRMGISHKRNKRMTANAEIMNNTLYVPLSVLMKDLELNVYKTTEGITYIDNYPDKFDYSWTKYRYIAHALGGIGKYDYTNSHDALLYNYNRGMRVFETDLSETADGSFALLHSYARDGLRELGLPFEWAEKPPTAEEFKNTKILGVYRTMLFRELVKFMSTHKDMWLVLDMKSMGPDQTGEIFNKIVDITKSVDPEVLNRLIPQIYYEDMFKPVMDAYSFKSVIFTMYRLEHFTEENITDYAYRHGIKVVASYRNRYTDSFIRKLKERGIMIYMFTYNDPARANRLFERGVHGVYTDFLPGNPHGYGPN